MDKLLDDVRKDACKKLRESETEDLTALTDTAIALIQFSEIARSEGLLALDEIANKLKFGYGRLLMGLISDGAEPDTVLEIGTNEYWTKNPQGWEAMAYYLYLRSILYIQAGEISGLMEYMFRTLLPEKCHSLFREKVETIIKNRDLEIAEKLLHSSPTFENTELIEKLQELEQEVKSSSNDTLHRILREMPCDMLVLCLLGLSEKSKEKVLHNLSARLARMLVDDMAFLSSGGLKEAEILEGVVSMIKTIHDLRRKAII